MKLTTFFISSTRPIFTKLLDISVSLIKITARSQGTLFVILHTSVVISKQRLLHGNDTVQNFQNCKCYNVEQDYFRKPL